MAGAFTGNFTRGFTVAGLYFGVGATAVDSSLATPWDETVAAAKTGTLTTRTSDTVGTLTLQSSHGVTTGARLDIYWTVSGVSGRRYGVTVGTVSVNSVPFSGGAGDNLPIAASSVTVMVPTELPVVVTGDDAVSVAAKCPVGGTVVFAASNNSTLLAVQLTSTVTTYAWVTGYGTNPLASASVAKVFLSHGNSGAASDLTGIVQFNP